MTTKYTTLAATIASVLMTTATLRAQQLPQFSQYMHNVYLLNPAAACLESDIDINLGFRQQWAGFDGAPQTYYLSGAIDLGKGSRSPGASYAIPISVQGAVGQGSTVRHAKHIVGGMAAVDEYGLFKRTSVMAGYAYHHPIGRDYYVGVGTSMGWYGLNFGADKVRLERPLDFTYNDFIFNGTRGNLFDINAGLFVYSSRAFVGYSVYQLGRNEINLGNRTSATNLSEARLETHHYVTGGYSIALSEDLDLTPSAMLKVRPPAPLSVDFNVRLEWQRQFWLGLSYRNQDAVSVLAGLRVNEWLRAGYSYDYVTSQINDLSSGSHEIVLGLLFNRKK
jgi:type IX secretion system PorP/SprF family membrane protein